MPTRLYKRIPDLYANPSIPNLVMTVVTNGATDWVELIEGMPLAAIGCGTTAGAISVEASIDGKVNGVSAVVADKDRNGNSLQGPFLLTIPNLALARFVRLRSAAGETSAPWYIHQMI